MLYVASQVILSLFYIVLHLDRHYFTVTSVMVRMGTFKTFNYLTPAIHALQLHDKMYSTFGQIFFIHYLYRYWQFQQEWPISLLSTSMDYVKL